MIYSTAEIDVVSELLQQQENLLQLYQEPKVIDNIGKKYLTLNAYFCLLCIGACLII